MSVCDVPVISTVCKTAGKAAASLISAPFDWLAQAIGGAAKWLFEAVWKVFDQTTLVDVTSKQYISVYNILFGVAVFVMLLFFCLQLISGLIHRDPTALSRAALGLAKSVLGSFVVITLTALALQIVDQLCTGIIQAAGQTTESMGDKIALLAAGLVGINIAAPGVGAIITIFLAGLAVTAAAIVWFSLLVRKALLLVAIVFAPLAFSGASWDSTKGWINKWAMFVLALICSKFVLVVMFLVAITQVSKPIDADLASISDPIAGVVLMAMAAFAPYLTYKFISFVGFDMYHAIGAEQDAKQALNRPLPIPGKTQGAEPKKVLDGGSDGGSDAPDSGGAAPPPADTTPVSPAGAGGGSAGTEAGAEAGASSAAGPAAVVVVGAQVAKAAAEAGPKAGEAMGGAAEGHADAAAQTGAPAAQPPSPQTPAPTSPSQPAPRSNTPAPPQQTPPSSPSGKE